MLKKIAVSLVVTGFLAMSANAHAAMIAYLYATGQKTGPVKGSVTQKGRDGSIAIIALEQMTKMEVSPTGVPSGRLRAGQVMITKEVDKSSPVLRQMMNNNEIITDATIQFWTPQIMAATGVGTEVQHYTLKLTNARIVSMKTISLNIRNPELVRYAMSEELALIYERADWIWINGGITATETSGSVLP